MRHKLIDMMGQPRFADTYEVSGCDKKTPSFVRQGAKKRSKVDTASGSGRRSNNRNADIAIGAERIEQNCIIAAQHSHINSRLTKLQVA
jgi:hypothetical protein